MFTRFTVVIVLLSGLLGVGGSATAAQAKPKKVVYAVKITIKLKDTQYPPGSKWLEMEPAPPGPPIAVYGQITSPRRACVRHRLIYVWEGTQDPGWVKNTHGILGTATGSWEGEARPDFFNIRESIRKGWIKARAKVARKRLSKGRVCAAATSANLKA